MLIVRSVLAASLVTLAAQAVAAENVTPDPLDRCLKSVNIIGASIGHTEQVGTNGEPMLHFVVRSNGSEYDVKCEAKSGMIKDVSAHIRSGVQ